MIEVKYKSAHLFGEWKFNFKQDICVICRNLLTESTELSYDYTKLYCSVVSGKCGHQFHESCINKWTREYNYRCAMCNKKWERVSSILDENNDEEEKKDDDDISVISQIDKLDDDTSSETSFISNEELIEESDNEDNLSDISYKTDNESNHDENEETTEVIFSGSDNE